MKKIFFVLTAVFAFAFMGCSGEGELKGTWKTIEMNQNGKSFDVIDSFIELNPCANKVQVHGNAGVNTFNGEITAKDGKIEGGDFATTRMMGSPEEMAFEDTFLEIISRADVYEIKDDVLVLKSNFVKGEIKFKKQ